jgi:hypothetical protein
MRARQRSEAAAAAQSTPIPPFQRLDPEISPYRDRRFDGDQAAFEACLLASTTLYVGNLSFFTTEEQIVDVFGRCGDVHRVVMGLDKFKVGRRGRREDGRREWKRKGWGRGGRFFLISATHTPSPSLLLPENPMRLLLRRLL